MAKSTRKHNACSVLGCTDQYKSLHILPIKDEDIRNKWMHILNEGHGVPLAQKYIYSCVSIQSAHPSKYEPS